MIAQEIRVRTGLNHVEVHAQLASTNDYAKRLARIDLLEAPGLILAECQTRGRGQQARSWFSDRDSLAVTFFYELEHSGGRKSEANRGTGVGLPMRLIPLVTADCLAEAISSLHPTLRPSIKWPNDVLLDGRKVAGILVETVPRKAGTVVIIGVGVNVNQADLSLPANVGDDGEAPIEATSLRQQLGQSSDRRRLLIQLAQRLTDALISGTNSTADGLAGYSKKLSYLNEKISIRQANKGITVGRLVGISSEGAVIIDTADGEKSFLSGSIRPSE